jgi:hypothetical protein
MVIAIYMYFAGKITTSFLLELLMSQVLESFHVDINHGELTACRAIIPTLQLRNPTYIISDSKFKMLLTMLLGN